MSGVHWIKLSVSTFDDEKIQLIRQLPDGSSVALFFIQLLTLAGRKNANGEIFLNDEIPYTEEMLADLCHLKLNVVRFALKTLQKFRMIEILDDRTIVICNWAKYQNLEGLEKVRANNAERVRRWREKQRIERNERLLSKRLSLPESAPATLALRNVTGNITERYAVTQKCVTGALPEEDLESEKKRVPLLPSSPLKERTEKEDEKLFLNSLNFSEAKQWLSDLFGRERPWSGDEATLLEKLVPISPIDQKLIQWAYSLRKDDEGWAWQGNVRLSKPRHSLIALLREFPSELDKWRAARHQCGLSLTFEDKPKQPADPEKFITTFEEAKRLICEQILKGKDPSRPWSHEAAQALEGQLPIPRLELERIAWFRSKPNDGSPELEARKVVTEITLMRYWSEHFTQANAFWEQLNGWREKKKAAE